MFQRFLILSLVAISCGDAQRTKETARPKETVATDTVVGGLEPYRPDPKGDSLRWLQAVDSFNRLPAVFRFVNLPGRNAEAQLMANFIDTGTLHPLPGSFVESEDLRFNADSMPVWRRQKLVHPQLRVEIIAITFNQDLDSPLQVRINGKAHRFGQEMDTSLTWDAMVYGLRLTTEGSCLFRAGNRRFAHMEGYLDNCNGNACGVTFHLLIDLDKNRSIAFSQYRQDGWHGGFNARTGTLDFCVLEDGTFNEYLDYMPFGGKFYSVNRSGRLEKLKDRSGRQLYFNGAIPDENFDSLIIHKAVPRSKR